jgi:hypothetical protein
MLSGTLPFVFPVSTMLAEETPECMVQAASSFLQGLGYLGLFLHSLRKCHPELRPKVWPHKVKYGELAAALML